MEKTHLDKKDYKILAELDKNFRDPFSNIGKKIGLSKNSVSLRFEKLKEFMTHNMTGINHHLLGYKMIKIFYVLNNYNLKLEKEIEKEVKNNKNILWAAKIFGDYDLEVNFLVESFDQLISQINNFEKNFVRNIRQKDLVILEKEFHKRYDFLHETSPKGHEIPQNNKKIKLKSTERKILSVVRNSPRISIIEISRRTRLTPKTITNTLNKLSKKRIITGYFLALNLEKFGFEVYKLLIQLQDKKNLERFENYIIHTKNLKHLSKMIGHWDYELDVYSNNLKEIQIKISEIKEKFPEIIKRVFILSHGKRIATNKETFLES